MATNTKPVELGESWEADRILDEEMRGKLQSAIRDLLSIDEPEHETKELTEGLPLDIKTITFVYTSDYVIECNVYTEHKGDLVLTTDDVHDCGKHVEGDSLSTLAAFGEEYAALQTDLLEVVALMADLPEFADEREEYVVGSCDFSNIACYDGTALFTFMCYVVEPVRGIYQEANFELGRRVSIPVEPSISEIISEG